MLDKAHNLTLLAVYAISLMVATFIGYSLAVGQGIQNYVLVAGIAGLLLTPLIIRSHLAVLLFCWNSTLGFYFLPGKPPLWMLMAFVSVGMAVLHRTLDKTEPLNGTRALTTPIFVFGAVVLVTMLARGGVGIQWLGSGELSGGRKYFWILGALIGYFALSLQPIPQRGAALYVVLFCLGGLTGFIGPLGAWLGGPFAYLQVIFNPVEGVYSSDEMFRVKGMSNVGNAIFSVMLARYGFGGVFHTTQFWRPLVLVLGMALGLLSGYRTLLLLYAGSLLILFVMEGWHRSKWILGWACAGMLGLALLFPLTPHLPAPLQRAIAFLPVPVDTAIRMDAESTLEWRQGLWDALLEDVPRYLWFGKGMTVSTLDMEWADTMNRFGGKSWYTAYLVGEHHNGFLSVCIAFGIWGVVSFLWLICAGAWVLWRNWKFGRADLRTVNAFLFAFYLCWIFLFFSYWGTLYWSLRDFTGVLGLSVALNRGLSGPSLPNEPEPANEEQSATPAWQAARLRPR